MGWLEELRKQANKAVDFGSRVYDTVNVNDGGLSWNTRQISQERQQQNALRDRYKQQNAAPKQSFGNKLRDVLDTNTEADQWRRQQQNYVDNKLYGGTGQQEIKITNAPNLFDNTLGAAPRVLNTAGRYVGTIPIQVGMQFATAENNTARKNLQEAEASGDRFAVQQAWDRLAKAGDRLQSYMWQAEGINNQMKRYDGGLFGTGTMISGDQLREGDLKNIAQTGLADTAQAGLDVASLGLGGVTGKALMAGGTKNIGRNLVKQAPRLTANAGLNYGTGVSSAYADAGYNQQDLAFSDANKAGLLGAGIGTVADIGLGLGYQGAKGGVKKVANVASDPTTQLKVKSNAPSMSNANAKIKGDRLWKSLDDRLTNTVKRMEKSTGKLKANYEAEARELLRLRNSRAMEISQGGFIGKGDNLEFDFNARTVEPEVQTTPAKINELPEETRALTQTQGQPPVPPRKPPVGADGQPLLGTGQQKGTRYASKTIPESDYVAPEIKAETKKNAPLYTPENEKLRYNQALTKYEKLGRDKFEDQLFEQLNAKKGTISSSTVAEAQALAARMDAEGNFSKASEIYDKISEHLTASGQTIQAAAIMSRRSPDGLRRHALQTIKKGKIEITPKIKEDLGRLTQVARQAKTEVERQRAAYAIGEYVRKTVPDNWWNKSVNIWRAGLLTSPMTTAGNVMANAGETAIRKGFVNPISTIADATMGAFTGKRTMTFADAGSASKGFKEGAKTLPEYFRTGFEPGDAAIKAKYENSGTINYGNGPLGKAVGGYVNGVYRLMGVADSPFRKAAEYEVLTSLANAEAVNKGLKGNARKQFVREFLDNPPAEAVQRASDESMRATFQNDTLLNDAAQGIKRSLERKSAPAKAVSDFVIPFVRTPSAIATRMIERTPIGVAKEIVNQIVNVKAGRAFDQRAMSQAIGNGTFGVLAIGAGMKLAEGGNLTFGYPQDSQERKLWELEGKQSYSIKVGDRWYSFNYLQPFGTLLAIGGQAAQDMKDGKSAGEATTKALATAGQSIQEQSFLKGVNGVLTAISDPDRSARRYMEQTLSSLTPNFIRAGARASDPLQREPTTVVDSIKSGVPGLRQQTPVKKDVFGRDLPAKDNFLNQYLNPLRPSKVRSDALTSELRRLKDNELGVFPSESNKNVFGEENQITKDELNDLNATIAGKIAEQWEKVVGSADYRELSDEDKKKTLEDIKRDYSAVAKAEWAYNNGLGADYKPDLTTKQKSIAQGDAPDYVYEGLPKNLNKTAKRILTEDATDEWKRSVNNDVEVKSAITSWLGEGVTPPPINNEVAKAWANYEKKKAEGTLGKLEDESERKSILKSAYNSQLNKDEKDLYQLSEANLVNAYNNGLITDENIENALAVERQLYDAGLISKETLARKWSGNARGYKSAKSGGRRSGGGRKKSLPKLDMTAYTNQSRVPTVQNRYSGSARPTGARYQPVQLRRYSASSSRIPTPPKITVRRGVA